MKKQVFLDGNPPETDDFGIAILSRFVDGRTNLGGAWATMAPMSYMTHGVGLGLGRGQQYDKQADGRWLKTAG